MAVDRLVAIGVGNDDHVAVAGVAAGLLDHAVAGGKDRRAARRGEVDAGMHARVFEDRVAAHAEAGAEHAGGHRLPHQELLRALALVVIEVDDAVVGGAEAVEALADAVERERGEQHLRLGRIGAVLGQRVEDLERVAGADARLEVDVIGEDADELVDQLRRHFLLERGLVDGVVEPGHRAGIGLDLLLAHLGELGGRERRLVGAHEGVVVGPRDGGLVGALVVDADTQRHQRSVFHHVRRVGHADLLPDVNGVEVDQRRQRGDDPVDVLVGDLGLHEQLAEALALGDRDDPLLAVLKAGRAVFALGDVGDVLGNDLDAHRGEGVFLRRRELVAAAAGIDEGEGGHVGLAAAEIGRGADDRLDILGGHDDPRVLLDRAEGEVAHLDRDLAVDLGAVELIVGGGLGGGGRRRPAARGRRCRRRCGARRIRGSGRHAPARAASGWRRSGRTDGA